MQGFYSASAVAMPQITRYTPAYKPREREPAERRSPPEVRRAHGHSGRLFCRIYPKGSIWVLELEPVGRGSLDRAGRNEASSLYRLN